MRQRAMTIGGAHAAKRTRPHGGVFRRRQLPSPDSLRNKELAEVVDELGRPFSTSRLGLGGCIAYWTFGRTLVEIIFDQYERAERISIT